MPVQRIETELLYFGHGHASGAPMHSHPFYQLEYCFQGKLTGMEGKIPHHLSGGMFWLIAPEQEHGFSRNKGPVEYISIKFNTNLKINTLISSSPAGLFYLDEIRKIIDGESSFTAYSVEGKDIIEHLLSDLLDTLSRQKHSPEISDFERQLQQIIYQSGAMVSVTLLSEKFRLSRAEFKYLFLKETGSGQIKKYIDRTLLKISEQHLRYSDMSIRKIAEELHFSSIYTFSRFYKHSRGISPVVFRRNSSRH